MATLKKLAARDDGFVSGHALCPGCGIPIILKMILRASRYPLIVSNASGCLQMGSANFPRTSWNVNWIHTPSAEICAVMSGITAAYRSFKKQGKLGVDNERKFLVIGGDGTTYDSGFGSLSAACQRGDDIVYLCYDNQSVAHTGGQASSATPRGASTPNTPSGEVLPGKLNSRKNITSILASHSIPYIAQSAPWIWQDLYKKAEKAFETRGPAFLNVLSPCPTRWKIPTKKSVEWTRLASDTCIWPIFEITPGKKGLNFTLNYKPKKKQPVVEWLKSQGRFQHLANRENKWIVEKIQQEIDKEWELLLSLSQKDEKEKENNVRDN